MGTVKTKGVQTRLPITTLDYLQKIIKRTQADSMSDAIRLIVTERMLKDMERGEIAPFEYTPAPTRREHRRKKGTFPLGEPPIIAGPSPAPSGGMQPPTTEGPETRRKAEESHNTDTGRYWKGPVKVDCSALNDEEMRIMLEAHSEWKDYAEREDRKNLAPKL